MPAPRPSFFTPHPQGRVPFYIHALLWVLVEALQLIFFYYFFPIKLALMQAISNLPLFLAVFYANVWLIDRFMERQRYGMYALLALLLLGTITVIRYQLNLQFDSYGMAFPVIDRLSKMMAFMAVSTCVVQVVSALYRLLENRVVQQRQRLEQINRLATARMNYLMAQINPHFLFNTLNNIYALSVMKSDVAPQMILRLSDLLRYSIYGGKQEWVPLSEEAKHIEQYISLFRMRSEESLQIEFSASGDLKGSFIAPMLLIPLVENCFKHGNLGQAEGAFARISLEAKQEGILFFAENTYSPAPPQADGGVGIQNVRERLALLYPGNHRFDSGEEMGGVFCVRLEIKGAPGKKGSSPA